MDIARSSVSASPTAEKPSIPGWDIRHVEKEVYNTYRSRTSDDRLIDLVSDTDNATRLQKLIEEFRHLVNMRYNSFKGHVREIKKTRSVRTLEESHPLGGIIQNHSPNDERNYVEARNAVLSENPRCVQEIRRLLQKEHLAVALLMGDWLVSRDGKSQAEMCGTEKFSDIETFMVQWYHRHGVLSDELIRENIPGKKLVHLSLGCGNGDLMKENQENRSRPLGTDKGMTSDYWTEVGMCDRIYFSISSILRGFLKGGYDPAILGVCDFLTTCINRSVQAYEQENPGKNHPLRDDIDYLKMVLIENAEVFCATIQDIDGAPFYFGDGEFPDGKEKIKISNKGLGYIRAFSQNPEKFLAKYFSQHFTDDIAGRVPFAFHNTFISDFSEFDSLFHGKEERFHMVTSVRGDSHIDNKEYINLLSSVCRKLKPGGIVIDDGIRRSYTRELRWELVHALSRELGGDYQFHIIRSSDGVVQSLMVQKVLKNNKGERVFFTREEIVKNITGKDGGTAVALANYGRGDLTEKVTLVQEMVRSKIMGAIMEDIRKSQDSEKIWGMMLKLGPVHEAFNRIRKNIREIVIGRKSSQAEVGKIDEYINKIVKEVLSKLGMDVLIRETPSKMIARLESISNTGETHRPRESFLKGRVNHRFIEG